MLELILIGGIALMSIIHILTILRKNKKINTLQHTIYNKEKECEKCYNTKLNAIEDEYLSEIRVLNNKLETANIKIAEQKKKLVCENTRIWQFRKSLEILRLKKNWLKDRITEEVYKEYQNFKKLNPRKGK